MKILCIIPARSGSKGIKNKNLKIIYKKKTLIEFAYDIALKSKLFSKIIVSTDSPKYQKYLKTKKINLNFLRPKRLSGDNADDLSLIKFELKRYSKFFNIKFDGVCLLQPTSPVRKINDLRECFNLMNKRKLDAVWTISEIDKKFHPIKILKIQKKYLNYFSNNGSSFTSRQNLDKCYIRNGLAYFFSEKAIEKYNTILPKKTGYLLIKREIANIDNISDLIRARKLVKK